MTRENARDFLVSLGVEEPTKEAIDSYLNQFNGEKKKYETKLEQGRKDAETVDELRAKLEAIENQNLSDIEKANKTVESANKTIAELEAKMKAMELKASLAEKGIVGEDADELIKSIGSGGLDVELLGRIIQTKMNDAATQKEKEIADNSTNPNGGKGEGSDPKPADVVNAESMANAFGTKVESDKQNYYVLN